MSSWDQLRDLDVTIRPFSGARPPVGNNPSPFSAGFNDTLHLLARELRMLDAKHIVLEAGFHESQLRMDGLPRASTRMDDPAIALSFDSKHGPLRYATSEYWNWQSNLRAIALSMEALRAVDRHGVSKRGEQYVGWAQLPEKSSEPADLIRTREQAQQFLDTYGGSFAEAVKRLHPDMGGTPELFRAAVRSREILEA